MEERHVLINESDETVRLAAELMPAPSLAAPAAAEMPATMSGGLRSTIKETESALIRDALTRKLWKVSAVARDLQVSRSTLYERMKLYGIKRPVN
jgi:transcriptional regulator of acetoin/glycerol metabolism